MLLTLSNNVAEYSYVVCHDRIAAFCSTGLGIPPIVAIRMETTKYDEQHLGTQGDHAFYFTSMQNTEYGYSYGAGVGQDGTRAWECTCCASSKPLGHK